MSLPTPRPYTKYVPVTGHQMAPETTVSDHQTFTGLVPRPYGAWYTGCYTGIHRYLPLHPFQLDDDDDELLNRPVIQGITLQGYNALLNYTHGWTAQHHEVQVSQVTAALAGMFANTPQHINICRCITWTCQQALPHQAFAEKVQSTAISTDLWLENVFCIDMKALRSEQRNGW